jgi:large subunit ribosomal protein L22
MATKPATTKTAPQVAASANALRIAPRKMRLVTNMVRGMRASDAITQLQFTNKKGAPYLAKLIRSAIANAENNMSLKAADLFVKSITCNMGQTMRRYFPRARGSAFIIRRKTSQVNVILEERPGAGKKSRFALTKRAKKDEPIKTQEGSQGEPTDTIEAPETTKATKATEHHATHKENEESAIKEKANTENQLK